MNLTDIEAVTLIVGWVALMAFGAMLFRAISDMLEKGKYCPYCGERH